MRAPPRKVRPPGSPGRDPTPAPGGRLGQLLLVEDGLADVLEGRAIARGGAGRRGAGGRGQGTGDDRDP